MALLPQDPRDQKRFLGVIVVLALGALYFFYVYTPKQDELAELEDRIAQVEEQNRRAEARTGNLDETREELRRMEDLFAALEELVPPRAEVPAIYESVAEQVETLGLELNMVTPASPEPVEQGYYLRQNWQMEVEGTYHRVGEFITRVASFPRIVRPTVNELRPGEQTNTGASPVVANLGLEMFVLAPDSLQQSGAGEEGQEGDDDGSS